MLAIKQSHGIKKYLADDGNRASFVRVARDLGTVFNKLDTELPRQPARTTGIGANARNLAPWQSSNIERQWLTYIEGTWNKAQKTLNDFIAKWHGWVTTQCTPAKLTSYQDRPTDTQAQLDQKAEQREMCQGLVVYNRLPANERAPLTRPKTMW